MTPEEVASNLHQIIEEVGSALSDRDRQSSLDLVSARETLIALENLCTQIYEYDQTIRGSTADKIARTGKVLSMDPRYWELLDESRPERD